MVQYTYGVVNITDMTNFYPESRDVQPAWSEQQSTAHLYGDSKDLPYRGSFIPADLANGCDLVATFFPYGTPGSPDYGDYTYLELSDENSTEWKYHVGNQAFSEICNLRTYSSHFWG